MSNVYVASFTDRLAESRARRLDEARALLKKRVDAQIANSRTEVVQRRASRIAFQLRRAMG
ncbi:MAG: hypothetical protein ACFB22_08815 [Rhodothalassiaceae bacterium]